MVDEGERDAEGENLENEELKRRKVQLEIEELEEDIAERRRRREEETREAGKWKRAKKVWGGTKKVGGVAHGVVTLGSGWIGFFLFAALVIWILDSSYGYIGVTEFSFVIKDIWNLVLWTAFLIMIAYHIIKNWGEINVGELVTYGIAVMTVIFVMFTGTLNWLGFIHLVFIGALWWVIIRGEEGNKVKSNLLLSVLIIVDFYRFVILKEFLPMTVVVTIMRVPFLLIGSIVGLGLKFPEKKLPQFALFALFVVAALFNWQSIVLASRAVVKAEEGVSVIGPSDVLKGAWVGITDFFKDIKISAEQQLDYATGGYYRGTVEENEKEQLGVYLENVEAADTQFLENEVVILWGDLKARTLDDPIYVYMSCESGDIKGDISPKVLSNPEYLGNYQKGYEVQKLEEVGFECRFNKGLLGTGANTIKIKAEFNFKTLAFLKTYFMDIERIRALRRENIDPLVEYGIKDKTPTAVFTNGPVRLGMGTVDPPLGVYADNDAYSYVGVTVEKQWNGEIKNIKEIVIQVPKVFELDPSGELFCRGDFKKEKETEDGYAVYNMTKDVIEKIKTPISQYRSWRCSMKVPKASAVLGNTPVTTFYYRAGVKYTYEIEQSINVYIKAVAGEKTMLSGCEITCRDDDGCICDADNCKIPRGSYVGKGYTCDNYGAGASFSGGTVQEDLDYINARQAYIEGMIAFRDLCMKGDIGEINKVIDGLEGLSNEEKEALKNDDILKNGCVGKSPAFFEITEELIVGKVKEGVARFKVLVDKVLTADEKSRVNTEKTEFLGLLDKVITNFRDINRVVKTEKNEENIRKVGEMKTELENINFG